MTIVNGAGASGRERVPRPDLTALMRYYGLEVLHGGMHQCLVHDDSIPSMNVDTNKALWYCHACGRGGTAWDLIMVREGVDFNGAQDWARNKEFPADSLAEEPEEETVFGRKKPVVRRGGRRNGNGWKRPW